MYQLRVKRSRTECGDPFRALEREQRWIETINVIGNYAQWLIAIAVWGAVLYTLSNL